MTLTPLLNAAPAIQFHAVVALLLLPLTAAIFALPRGSRLHRALGWTWVSGMSIVAISSFWIHQIRMIGDFSPIHALSVFTLAALVANVTAARRHRVAAHRRGMKATVFGALLLAGAFTLFPGRIMFRILTGG